MPNKGKLPDAVLDYFRKEGARGGKKGGVARMESMTAEERSELARKAAAASAKVRTAKAAKKKTGKTRGL